MVVCDLLVVICVVPLHYLAKCLKISLLILVLVLLLLVASLLLLNPGRGYQLHPRVRMVNNYALWAKAVEVYYEGESESHFLIDDPPSDNASWKPWDVRIHSELWNSMEEDIARSLMFLDTTKHVCTQTQEMYSSVNNLCCTYDLDRSFFSISQGSLSLDEYYSKFRRICDELHVCEPLSSAY